MTPDEISVKEHLEKIIELKYKNIQIRLDSMDKAIAQAEKVMDEKLSDYPEQFVRKEALTEIKTDLQLLNAETDSKLKEVEIAVHKMNNLRANINGRLFALGAGALILITAFEFVNHYIFKVR